jgi:flagellar hook-associated protein 3 FlgL
MQILERGQVNINNAKENINNALGHVGGRLSNIEQVIDSNDSLNVIKQETKANISEIDVYEAVENLLKEQNALNVAKQTFTLVNGQSLFDFI